MKNRKLVFMLFCIALIFNQSYAQTILPAENHQDFRTKVTEKAALTQSIECDFVQEKHLSVLNNIVISTGKMVFLNPNKITWQYITPYNSTAIFKDNKLFTIHDGKKKTVDLNSNKLFKNFNQLIINSIRGNMFNEKQFEISYFKLQSSYLVKFVPKEKRFKNIMSAFELSFNEKSFEVDQIKIFENSEDYTLIRFLNRKNNVEVSDSAFQH